MEKLTKLLTQQENNYIFPFLWMHGESKEVIEEYMHEIYKSGIRAVCVEPRPHPDFVGERWWKDLQIVLEVAKEKNMKVWLFDDAHFPTGYANGAIIKHHPELRKKFLKITQLDFHGPQRNAGIIVRHASGDRNSILSVGTDGTAEINGQKDTADQIIGIIAAKIIDYNTVDTDRLVDITKHLENGVVYWDVPEGNWRIFILVETFSGGERSTEGYLNPIDPNATQVLIDTVYQPHFDKFSSYFGTTIAGFFTDEPRFGNIKGPDAIIGKTEMVLPWHANIVALLEETFGKSAKELLPLLLTDGTKKQHQIRHAYMNLVSKMYAENFTNKLAHWCTEHGVEYVGHLIEDNNAHGRLGYGAGHFFRALGGQSMSGIDVVLHQLLPGMDEGYFKTFTSTGWDGEFFHYGLGKLGASLGHLDSQKKGRTMCEIYGAYGWSEGLNLMKWMTDHMLVRGINHFVPHSFDMAPFPDADCPPHFYAHGINPQHRYLHLLMNYTNRVSELLSDGQHVATSLILYHAEAEWSGNAMLFQKPAKVLTQNQIDFDIVSLDLLMNAEVKNNKILLHQEEFHNLVIPYAERLPKAFFEKAAQLIRAGAMLIFINALPVGASEDDLVSEEIKWLEESEQVKIVPLEKLASMMRAEGAYEIMLEKAAADLRYYQYRHLENTVYMFFNESPDSEIINKVTLKESGYLYKYDPWENNCLRWVETIQNEIPLFLAPQEAAIWIVSDCQLDAQQVPASKQTGECEITGPWEVSLATAAEYPSFHKSFVLEELTNIAKPSLYPAFSGSVRYQKELFINDCSTDYQLDLGEAYEIAEVFINDSSAGVKVSKPYVYDISPFVQKGRNLLTVEVTNTLGTAQKDYLSQYRILQPTGLLGSVKLKTFQK
ncbi:glycosylhydrolase-like jelly roll fold domain-containing protein [Bacillus sp. Au-Bac7]|uniref:glycosylhydrolase-like jelly roll fold domain-containing protein n=1 Tax=Bacillus sp. Au-Bac7 TaxID=2906458 RepID=UPI001E4E0047|nr:glycosylhydrolase-like jelly roll fold domain-containing protein [Bacillus sp. Au-Bac7]MCE4047600.1 glycoside hydrolase [Bacillus sp. Au-Bac7]